MMKMMRMAYFVWRSRKRAVTSPMRARKYTIVGIWKISPNPSSIFTYRLKASPIDGRNSMYSVCQLRKNFQVHGKAT